MSTLALNKLLEYILSLSLSDKNKDWLAGKIIESKATKDTKGISASSLYGTWKPTDYSCEDMIDDIKSCRSFKDNIVEF